MEDFVEKLFYAVFSLTVLFILFVLGEMYGVFDQAPLMQFLEQNFSADGKISNPRGQYIKILALCLKVVAFCLGGLFLLKQPRITSSEIGFLTYISVVLFVLISVFTVDQRVFFADSFGEYYEPIRDFLFKEDHLMESLTVVFLFVASIQFFRTAKEAMNQALDKRVVWGLLMVSGFCMLMMMEEISWGQRIFNWETPESIRDMNNQQETNVHNFLNPVLDHLVDSFAIVLSFILIYLIKLRFRMEVLWVRGLLPESKYYYTTIFLFIAALADLPNELLEEFISLILLFYSFDIWKSLSKYPLEKDRS